MKTFENTELGVKFDLPEDITLRQELNYFSTVDPSVPWMLAAWQAAMTLVKNWECETIPDPHKLDLDKKHKRIITQIIVWVGTEVSAYVNGLGVPSPK